MIQGLVRVMRRVHADRQIEIVLLPDPANLAFRGEEQDLQEMLGNLIDNASKWARSRIEIQVSDESGKLRVSIDDDGKGIAETERDHVLKRGYAQTSRFPVRGWGLP